MGNNMIYEYQYYFWRHSLKWQTLEFTPATRLLSQGYKVNRLSNTFKKFYGRHTDLVGQKMSAKCLLILSVEMIFIFDGFADGQINKIS